MSMTITKEVKTDKRSLKTKRSIKNAKLMVHREISKITIKDLAIILISDGINSLLQILSKLFDGNQSEKIDYHFDFYFYYFILLMLI